MSYLKRKEDIANLRGEIEQLKSKLTNTQEELVQIKHLNQSYDGKIEELTKSNSDLLTKMQTSESEMREIKRHHNPIHSIIIQNLNSLLFGKTGLVKCSPMRKGIHAALVKNISYEDYSTDHEAIL